MVGSVGVDVYIVDAPSDVVVETAGDGVDTIQISAPCLTLGSKVENLSYVGISIFSGFGNGRANKLSGGAGSDRSQGLAGNDTFIGGGGADVYLIRSVA